MLLFFWTASGVARYFSVQYANRRHCGLAADAARPNPRRAEPRRTNVPTDSSNHRGGQPRFEYYPPNSATLQTVSVEKLPFTIGRGAEADLQIASSSVSREHVQLTSSAGQYVLRDLGSTNGTSVNGEPIAETKLRDGDVVRVADVDLTFLVNSMSRLQRMVTRPLSDPARPAPSAPTHVSAEVGSLRSIEEALLWQAPTLNWTCIVDRRTHAESARVCRLAEPLAGQVREVRSARRCSPAARLQSLAWRLAAAQAAPDAAGALLLHIESPALFGGSLLDDLEEARELLPEAIAIGVAAPWEWASRDPKTLESCARLQEAGAQIAFDHFSGGANCVRALREATPDFLVLSAEVVQGIAGQIRLQQRLKSVVGACEELGIPVATPPLHHEDISREDFDACARLGVCLTEQPRSPDGAPPRAPRRLLV
ncbi:FHA domain-containing protein FhaA [Pirellulimonas nuda]|uniref:FHA domain-containing protein FhaA n=1 Tax=Pirellulimonas nuda TaxID=2528009 RepID=A0A518D9A4_9BACT|nr:FHA domain-containing protein [Pirellulimonas nuda]QDU88045.1 FHA domain-containing protein FhaA [Pirellulimonas nuda]